MKGTKIHIVFPEEVYTFLNTIAKKMQTLPAVNPATNQPLKHPVTGELVHMSQTGKVEELLHVAIHSSIFGLIAQHPSFTTEAMQLPRIIQVYGKYLEKMNGNATTQTKG